MQGSPDSQATDPPTPANVSDPDGVQEVHPPTPGSSVTKDPENAGMVTPKRAQVFTATPADDDKKAGSHAGHPVNLP